MACRVGMSTNPDERIKYWKAVEGHTHSRILARGMTYENAIKREKEEAQKRGCRYQQGGQPVSGRAWSIYHLWGGS